jgi:hypothetical protein
MNLFGNSNRTYDGPALHNENVFNFLNRSSRPASARIRETIETWFTRYPDNNKFELKARFQSEFHSAFYELFMHELLFTIGCEIHVHPLADSGSSTHPDFLARFPSGSEVFMEAVLLTDEAKDRRAKRARNNTLYDEINKMKSQDFFLHIKSVTNPRGIQPSGRKVRDFLNRRLKDLNPDEIFEIIRERGFDAIPKWTFSDGDFKLEVSPIPKSPGCRDKSESRLIGIYPGETRWGGITKSLRRSVTIKAKQHGHLNRPYIVAVNCLSIWGIDEDDISDAFIGNHGVFRNYSRISAALVTAVYPSNIPKASVCLYHSPYADKPCKELPWKINQSTYWETKWQIVKGVSIGELMGLPTTWPGELFGK